MIGEPAPKAFSTLGGTVESFTSVAGAGDDITPQAFQAETEVLFRLIEIATRNAAGVERIPAEKVPHNIKGTDNADQYAIVINHE